MSTASRLNALVAVEQDPVAASTNRTARSRTSGDYLFGVSEMTPSSQGLEPA
ncbi:MAG: hypothetical protein WCJ67_12475 [Thermoleophilia bacterium]